MLLYLRFEKEGFIMDYLSESLKQYFNERNYSKNERKRIININPFGSDYTKWEALKSKDCKYFADTIKRRRMLKLDDKLYELCINPNFRVSSSLILTDNTYKLIPYHDRFEFVYPHNHTVIMSDIDENAATYLERLTWNNIPFIAGLSTGNLDYYKRCREFYIALAEELNLYPYEDENQYHQKIILLNSRKH